MPTEKTINLALTFDEVKNNIKTWNDIRFNSTLLKTFFEGNHKFQIDHFSPDDDLGILPLGDIHIYPAISDTGLELYLIKASNDMQSVFDDNPNEFINFIHVARRDVSFQDVGNGILPSDAQLRIDKWNVIHEDWIDFEAPLVGIFQAFHLNVTSPGLQKDSLASFALLTGYPDPLHYEAEIIFEVENNPVEFYNTTRPVPPFGQEGEEAFFLLEAATTM